MYPRGGPPGTPVAQSHGATRRPPIPRKDRSTMGGSSPGVHYRPANGSLSAGNIRRIFYRIFETPCAE
eukprot:9476788-Pyramimonas_sp.AAC.1